MVVVVKKKGHEQEFDERKVYASVYAACLTTRMTHDEAELIANEVTDEVKGWLKDKEKVDTNRILVRVTTEMERLNPDAALMYKTHRDIN